MLILLFSILSYSQDFTVAIPTTDNYSNYLAPLKAGSTDTLEILVKNNRSDTCKVSIDEYLYGDVIQWSITRIPVTDTLSPSETDTLKLIINVPTNTTEGIHFMNLYFSAYNIPNNDDISFDYNTQSIIIDNSPPDQPSLSTTSTSTTIEFTNFNSWDYESRTYTTENPDSGENGIEKYIVYIKNLSVTVASDTIDANNYHIKTFENINSNTSYIAGVTAVDLAGNTSNFETNVTTSPAPPVISYTEINYCNISLAWNSISGAVSYNIYNLDGTTSILLDNTSNTTYNVEGLTSGSSYKFYVQALNSSGNKSDRSNYVEESTLSVPTPTISGSSPVCASGTSFYVNNKPDECSVSWLAGPYLTLYSTNGNSATFKSTGGYANSWVKAIYDSGCGTKSDSILVDSGSPKPGSITILWDVPPRRFTAYITPIPSATSYKWYLDGVLKFDSPEYDVFFARQIWNCEHIYDVDVKAVNACGESAISHTEVIEDPCDFTFKVYPNPASNEITVSQNDLITESTTLKKAVKPSTTIKSIKIIDQNGNVYFEKQYKITENEVKINISFLKKGSYFVVINYMEADEEILPIIKN